MLNSSIPSADGLVHRPLETAAEVRYFKRSRGGLETAPDGYRHQVSSEIFSALDSYMFTLL